MPKIKIKLPNRDNKNKFKTRFTTVKKRCHKNLVHSAFDFVKICKCVFILNIHTKKYLKGKRGIK